MQPGAGRPRPSPSAVPRRRSVPPAPIRQPRGLDFSESVPHHGRSDAIYVVDTGVMCSVAMDEVCCHKFLQHLPGRMCTTDVIVEEVKNRASRRIGPDGVRMKAAADCAQRRLIAPGEVEVEAGILTDDDANSYDRYMQQLRSLAQVRKGVFDEADLAERHAGEASAMVLCERKRAAGAKVVFLTNDGDASTIAARLGIEVIHFGHALHELVCANLLTSDQAWGFYQRAVGMSGIPKAAQLRAASDLVCSGTPGDCPACAIRP